MKRLPWYRRFGHGPHDRMQPFRDETRVAIFLGAIAAIAIVAFAGRALGR